MNSFFIFVEMIPQHSDGEFETKNLQLHVCALSEGQFRKSHIQTVSYKITDLIQVLRVLQ